MLRFFLLILMISLTCLAENQSTAEVKGLLSEIRLNDTNEEQNLKKSFDSEVMISKSENKAIESLKKIISKKTGTREEPDLLYRLAELYMRRSRSGHFFDLDRKYENQLKQLGLEAQKAQDSLKQAVKIYDLILAKFPHFYELDNVLFNNALAQAQLKNIEQAKKHYLQLISRFPNSSLVPDALLEVGELFYQQQNFQTALNQFKEIEKFQGSRAYPYGLYKSAWCYYNLKNTDAGIRQLLSVVQQNPATKEERNKYNLRQEALNDLTLFVGESLQPHQVFGFFDKICTTEELGKIMLSLSGLYESHSRHKEISVFADQFIKAYPESSQAAELYTKLIDSLETLKQRENVLKKLESMASFCRDRNEKSNCKDEFKKVSLDISKKWWEIWLKNKSNKEFASLTEKAFENLLSLDSAQEPDSKSRYAFAELLFQQEKYLQASIQYEQVSKQPKLELGLAHDSLYAALVSLDKALTAKETPTLIDKQKELALRYYTEFKKSEHIDEITYKLGFIAYQQKQYDLALNYLNPLSESHKNLTLATQSQDLILDIYNIKKDYVTIQKISKKLLSQNPKDERQKNLTKILEESHYTQLQIDAKSQPVPEQVAMLIQFAQEHQASSLAQDSFWQAISLAYAKGFDVKAASLSLDYIAKYPQDKRKIDALKDASAAFINSAQFDQAIKSLKLLSQNLPAQAETYNEQICDLLQISESLPSARSCYNSLFKTVSKAKKVEMLNKLLATYSNTNSSEYRNLQNQILLSNIEPYATQILIQQANQLLDRREYKQAFSLSLKINARPVGEDVRAEARLIQAQILESEFVSQSVKAREDKMAMVIAMKTEKLDKSLTAFTSALRMAQDEKVHVRALQGIDRLYSHFILSINNIPMPASLSANDQKNLRQELSKITEAFAEKKKINQASLAKLSQLSTLQAPALAWSEMGFEKSIEPRVQMPDQQKISWYLLQDFNSLEAKPQRAVASTGHSCRADNITADGLNSCLKIKNYKVAESICLSLTSTPEKRAIGLYYLSLIAEAQNQTDKALWLADKSLEQNKKSILPLYQKAKVLYSVETMAASLKYFEKTFDMKESSPEIRVILAIKAFSDRDFKTAFTEFNGLTPEQNYTYGVDLLHIETQLQKGDIEQALKLAQIYSGFNANRVDLNLEIARIYESFVFNKDLAISYYSKAAEGAKSDVEQKNWITKKIEFLKLNNNQITSHVGG